MTDTTKRLTPNELAQEWRVSPAKVRKLIEAGELRAINMATSLRCRPRWFIDRADVERFEALRAARPEIRPQRRQRNRAGIVEFI